MRWFDDDDDDRARSLLRLHRLGWEASVLCLHTKLGRGREGAMVPKSSSFACPRRGERGNRCFMHGRAGLGPKLEIFFG